MPKLSIDHLIARCGRDLTDLARAGQLKRAYGCDRAARTFLRVLSSDVRHNPLVTGPARCGKTALVYEAVGRLAAGDAPEALRGRRVIEVTPGSILTGLQFGKGWRTNLSRLLDKLQHRDDTVLFLRDAHDAVRAGVTADNQADLAAFLEPYLGQGQLRWIAEGEDWRVRDLLKRHPAWSHAFVSLPLEETSPEETRHILDAVCEDVYLLRDVVVEPGAREAIIETCRRFVLGHAFPGKAIDALEDALATATESDEPAGREWPLTAAHVYRRFSERTGLNRLFLDPTAPFDETVVYGYLAQHVVGQETAVSAVARALSLVRAGLNDPGRPLGVFLFIGPTGVGKTELARTLARFLFGSAERVIRFNMADYVEAWQGNLLFGDPDEYEPEADRRGLISMRLGADGLCVMLLDEFEKAHPLVRARFLQLLDEGLLINGMGEQVNLRHVIFVLTSNYTAFLPDEEPIGFLAARDDTHALAARVLRQAEEYFTPEMINRIDSVCFFTPLSHSDMRRIAFRKTSEVFAREGLTQHGIDVEMEDAVIDLMLEQGYSIRYGARFLKRQIEKALTYPVARAILAQPDHATNLLRLYVQRDRVEADFTPPDPDILIVDEQTVPWTRSDLEAALPALGDRLAALEARDQVAEKRAQMDHLLQAMGQPGFWEDERAARQQLAEMEQLARRVERVQALRRAQADMISLLNQANHQREPDLARQALRVYTHLAHDLDAAELESCLTGPWDPRDAILIVRPSGDIPASRAWAITIARVYLAWAQRHQLDGFEATVWDESLDPDSAGPPSLAIRVHGEGAYGFLRSETGVHRLAHSQKHGTERVKQVLQAQVLVLPAWADDELVPVSDDIWVRGQPLRASGELLPRLHSRALAGHRPSGTQVHCTCDRPQDETEARAQWLLRALLTARQTNLLDIVAQPGWGTVARTYDQYHANQVKDRRTGHVASDVRHVLEGHIDEFLQAYLRQRANRAAAPPAQTPGSQEVLT